VRALLAALFVAHPAALAGIDTYRAAFVAADGAAS
jgi:hypothetical protein